MQIDFTGHQLEVTEAIRQYTEKRFEKLHRHYPNIMNVHVTFSVEKLDQVAKAMLHVPGADIQGTAKERDMYEAIDSLAHKLERQLADHREKEITH